MRVGELLLQRGWVDCRALVAHDSLGMRFCSSLVDRGVITFDQASMALGEQHGCAAVLLRHLERRDPELAALLPEEVARQLVALPIGRLGSGALIVCVRDPSPATLATLARLLGEEPVLAVAPASYLERVVDAAYAPQELESHELEEHADNDDDDDIDVPIDHEEGSPAAEDFQIDVELPPPRFKRRAMSVVVPTLKAARDSTQKRDSLDATLAAFRDIDAPGWLFDVAIEYIAKHWTSSLLLTVHEKRAVGLQGHGDRITPTVARTCVLDFAEVAILELARTTQRIVAEPPAELGAEHDMLATLLGGTGCPIAAPIVQKATVSHVLAVADPVGGDRENALIELETLVEAMGTALARM